MDPQDRPSRFERRPGPNADPLTRRDEALAFAPQAEEFWVPPTWFERVAVVLFETSNAVNVGGVARAMANTGFTRLSLVNPVPFDRWDVIGVAHYTQHIVDGASVYATLDSALVESNLIVGLSGKHHRDKRNVVPFAEAVRTIAERAGAGENVSVLFGREATGLPIEALDKCHLLTTIPTNPAYPSLNLAQAALLVLYALFSTSGGTEQEIRPPRRRAPAATNALLEDLFADLERALEAIEFFKTRSRPGIMRSLRGPLQRAGLDRREASLLRSVVIEVRRYLQRRGLLHDIGAMGAPRNPDAPERETPHS